MRFEDGRCNVGQSVDFGDDWLVGGQGLRAVQWQGRRRRCFKRQILLKDLSLNLAIAVMLWYCFLAASTDVQLNGEFRVGPKLFTLGHDYATTRI